MVALLPGETTEQNLLLKLIDDTAEIFGASLRESLEYIGRLSFMGIKVIRAKWRFHLIVEQMSILGVNSLPFVSLSSVFVGFISTMTYSNLTDKLYLSPGFMGMMIGKMIFMELGPVIVGLILAARIGAKITSEIANMRISEQIDAYTCLSLEPFSYLLTPRVIACTFMGPVFFVFSSLTALISSQAFGLFEYGVSAKIFYNGMRHFFELKIIFMGLIKVIVFSSINALAGCYYGYYVTGGAVGIGRATRNSVVSSSLLILTANIILTKIFI